MKKPEVGQVLYSLNVGNSARNCEQKLTEVAVSKVGRKYFTTGEGWSATQYYLDSWAEKTDYSASTRLFESPQEWEDTKENKKITRILHEKFNVYGENRHLTIDQLRRILAIVQESYE